MSDIRDIYQAKMEADIRADFNAGAMDVAAVLPTGGGKSVVMSNTIQRDNSYGALNMVVAHRVELVTQMSVHVASRGIKHRIIGPKDVVSQTIAKHRELFQGRSFVSPDAICAVGGVDTIVARRDHLKDWAAQVDYLHTDEGHHGQEGNKWGTARELFTRARAVWWTASPVRADGGGMGRGEGGYCDTMVQGPTQRALIDMGALCDYDIAVPPDDENVEMDEGDIGPSGEYRPKKVDEKIRKSKIVGNIVKNYVKLAYGKRAICFAHNVETSNKIAADFNALGIPAASVSAETPTIVRDEMVRRFKAGTIWVLVNVDLFGEGFDVPACEVVIMARPTASLGLYLQMFGRALRTMAGKLIGLIIDHVGNWKRHGFPDKAHFWSLLRREKRGKKKPDPEEIPLMVCRGCSRPYERFLPRCPRCGWEPPLPDPQARTLQHVDGDLSLLGPERLAAMRAAMELPTPADVANRTTHVAGAIAGQAAANKSIERWGSQERLRRAFEQFAGIQRAKGRDDRETHKRIFLTLGTDVLTALAQPRAEMDKIASVVEGWYS